MAADGAFQGRILVIDDDPTVRRTVAEMLRRSGYEPLQAATHEEALSSLGRPDAVPPSSPPGSYGFRRR